MSKSHRGFPLPPPTNTKTVGATKGVPAVERATAILWLLAKQDSSMRLSQIARAIDILPSSCLHILRELAASRLIAIDPRQKVYRLGPGVIELARAASRQDPFAELAQPYLKEIAETYGVTATASAPVDDHHMVLVGYSHPPASISLTVTLGGRVPLLAGAAGRCLAAFSNHRKQQLKSAFSKVRWQVPMDFEQWFSEVEQVKPKGYSEDNGTFTKGVTTIAAPVFAPSGAVRGVVGVGAITAQMDDVWKAKVVVALKDAVKAIGAQLIV